MVNVDKAIIARIKKEGKTFEVLVDCDKALEYQEGKIESLDDVLATQDIYSDVKQGEHASENDMKAVFHTNSAKEVAAIIIKDGEIQLTTEHKAKLREEKRKQILSFIQRQAVDPQSGRPHTRERLEMVMDEAKVKIDEFKKAEDQIEEVLAKMRPLIPIKMETREVELIIPSSYAGSAYNILQRFGKVLKSDWLEDGGLKAVLELPAGLQENLENELNKLTKGDMQLKILERR
tara:strand:- start:2210 stop:2911 length:702 start_codon:yes stop_codon:yes gene_type:complete